MDEEVEAKAYSSAQRKAIGKQHDRWIVALEIIGTVRLARKVPIKINVILCVATLWQVITTNDTATYLLIALQVIRVVIHVVVESAVAVVLVARKGSRLFANDRSINNFVQSDGEVGVYVAEKADAGCGD
jgi:hypothetical protein